MGIFYMTLFGFDIFWFILSMFLIRYIGVLQKRIDVLEDGFIV